MLGRSRLPSLAKEGWTRHQEISPFLLKSRTGWFVQTPKQFLLNEPPRLRRTWWLRSIFLMAQPPLLCQGVSRAVLLASAKTHKKLRPRKQRTYRRSSLRGEFAFPAGC